MELRLLLAIVLSFLLFFVYQMFFIKKTAVHEIAPAQKELAAEKEASTTNEQVRILEDTLPTEKGGVSPETGPGRTITVTTDLYVVELSERAAAFQSFKLRQYREAVESFAPMKELIHLPKDRERYTPEVSFLGKGSGLLKASAFQTPTALSTLDASQETKALSFTWTSPEGITIVKTYSFVPNTYEIGLEVKVRNLSVQTLEDNLTVSLKNGFKETKASRYTFSGPAALIDGELHEIERKEIAEEGSRSGAVAWIAHEDQYFANAILPGETQQASMSLTLGTQDVLRATYVDPAGPVAPKTERSYQYKLYFGPKSLGSLRSVGTDLAKMLDFGFFDVLAKPLLYAMNAIYRFIPNYGIAIILITIVVKLLFWPLSNKSYKSMSQMKRLQPKMAELRAKYKNDKKMMNQELMNLYKVYKVNPLGGCLPMVLQIPVFFAFYKMLYQAIELRHAPFLLWINDLAAPDRLFTLDITVPLMAPPYGIPVLTLIMGASMFLQQKMSPPPGDPAQAKMMMFMPIFFTFIFINFPSGLVLYWLVNNILSIAQQYYIQKKTA
jgi:YidC/Oxa1 family membrane protein insertase